MTERSDIRTQSATPEPHSGDLAARVAEASDASTSAPVDSATFRELVERSRAGIYLIEREGFVYVNPRLAEIFGYTRDEIMNSIRPLDLVAEEDRERVARKFEERLSGAVPTDSYTFRGIRRDGDRVEVEVHGSRVPVDGEFVILGTVIDVTERARLEQALRTNEERYRLVVRAANTAVWDWDLASGAVLWNGECRQVLRYAPEELGSTIEWWYERVHRDDRERVVVALTSAIGEGVQLRSDEYRFRRGDGSYATIHDCCFVARDDRGVAVRVVGSMVDVTERKRSENAQRFLALASGVLDASLDEQAIVNRLVSLVVAELADCCMLDLLEPDGGIRRAATAHAPGSPTFGARDSGCFPADAQPSRYPIVRAIRTGDPVLVAPWDAEKRKEISLDIEGAETATLQMHSFMVLPLVTHGRTLGALTLAAADPERSYGPAELMVAEDLARRAAAAIDHARLYAEAQDALHARDDVLRIVSHDLRNPLDVIQLTAALLLDSGEERRKETVDKLKLIRKIALQMNSMIEDLLDATVMQAGEFDVERSVSSAAHLIDEACELLHPLAKASGVQLEWVHPRPDTNVDVDTGQILRVFSNLVGNAIKFTPQGGRVHVAAKVQDDRVAFSVSDTGPGIPPEQLPHVFKRFWQGRSGDRRGAGLGLVIAKGIVEAHGGSITAEAAPGRGASFSFTLPRGNANDGSWNH
jgi:PAS domain S-box-containing protein